VDRYDVAIVGGGVIGLSIALALRDSGLSIALIDAAPAPPTEPVGRGIGDWGRRVTALTPASAQFLDSLGAWSAMRRTDRVATYTDMQVWDGEASGAIHFAANDVGATVLGHIAESQLTMSVLAGLVSAVPTIHNLWSTKVVGCSSDAEGAELECDDGSSISAELVVAADGARSNVRDIAAMRTRQWRYQQNAIVATVELDEGHADTCWQAFLASGPLALLPLAESNHCSIVWSLDDDVSPRWEAASNEEFVDGLNRALSAVPMRVTAVSERATFPLVQSHAVDYVKDRIVLVGDAAHSIHPLAGQGINLGLADAKVLAESILNAIQRGGPWASAPVLSRYQRLRKTENLAMMAAMQAFKWGFGSRNPTAVMARNFGLRMVDEQRWIKNWFAKQAAGA
jgi:2-octaprenylphenol hydroxylase